MPGFKKSLNLHNACFEMVTSFNRSQLLEIMALAKVVKMPEIPGDFTTITLS